MPEMPRKPCLRGGCPKLTRDGYCEAHVKHRPIARGEASTARQSMYQTKRWKALRIKVIARDKWCQACEMQPATVADHIVARKDGGADWRLSNLQGLCSRCHGRKTARGA